MGALDHQLGIKAESVYGTPVTVDRFYEYDSESIEESYGRTEGDPLRGGSPFIRSDRFTPYFEGAAGSIELPVMTKGFGLILQHMLGGMATTGPAETSVYTHTATIGELLGKSLTVQMNRPLHPSGTNQGFTYEGGKITDWTIKNSVEENLMLELGLDFENVRTDTALASASYPSGMENFTWAGGVITIGGDEIAIDEISIAGDNGLDTDRRKIRGNTDKKEPTSARREATFSLKADFEALTQRNRAAALTRAGALAQIVATWTGPTLLGSTLYPLFQVTIPAARFDEWKGATEGVDAISQELSGAVRYDGTNSPLTIVYKSADTTA